VIFCVTDFVSAIKQESVNDQINEKNVEKFLVFLYTKQWFSWLSLQRSMCHLERYLVLIYLKKSVNTTKTTGRC